jgi:multiple sugar transport system permease protein/putative chitobiose transport system permease protein
MTKRRKASTIALDAAHAAVLVLLVLYTLFPILWSVGGSLRAENAEIFKYVSELSWHTIVPERFSLGSYRALFLDNAFYRPLLNSALVAIVTVIMGFVVNGLAGFAFAKHEFAGRGVLFAMYLFSFMIPFEMIAVPLYKTAGALGILETRAALILPMVANGMIVFLYRQSFQDIPDSLIESAVIDGAGTLRIFFHILVPLSKPVIISASLMMFIQQWDAFLWPLVAATNKGLKVIQVAISELNGEFTVQWGTIFAATTVAIAIPAAILVPLQKYYIQGISSTGLKE